MRRLVWRRKETFRRAQPRHSHVSYVPEGDAGWMEPLLPIGAQSGHDGLPGPSERSD